MNTIKCILMRHSYRGEYTSESVPRKDLKLIMEAGLAAPSGCNKQTVSLVAVDDRNLLDRLKAAIEPPIALTAPAFICVLTQKIYAYRNKCFAVQDYSAAIQNMLLAIVELGYESCWYEGHITDDDRICDKLSEILNIPEEYEMVCVLPVGKAASQTSAPNKKIFEERSWFNDFNNR